ncbi:MAG: hypothetical protein JRC86_10005 [Deltaproteobacteria bacterium]|nr:hypothetical protein [Deltaproteobacteria bacterium]
MHRGKGLLDGRSLFDHESEVCMAQHKKIERKKELDRTRRRRRKRLKEKLRSLLGKSKK